MTMKPKNSKIDNKYDIKTKHPIKIKMGNIKLEFEFAEDGSSSIINPEKDYDNLNSIENGKTINLKLGQIDTEVKVIGKLGKGGFGTVYKCVDSENKIYALKKIVSRNRRGIPCLMEASVMATYDNEYLNKAIAINASIDGLYILEDVAICDLRCWRNENKELSTPEKINDIFFRVCKGLEFLHSNGMVHGDVKSTNVLCYPGDIFKLSDFNLTTYVKWKSNIHLCTANHRPYELWMNLPWNTKIDIWSLGCTMFEIKYGYGLIPYQGKDSKKYTKLYINCLIDWAIHNKQRAPRKYQTVTYITPRIPNDINNKSDLFTNLMLRCLELYPQNRPSIFTVLQDPYFSKNNENNISLKAKSLNEIEKNPFYNLIQKSIKAHVPSDDNNLLELATTICYRYCKIVNVNNYLTKKVSVWIAKKLIRDENYSQEIPDIEDMKKFMQLEMDICNKLEFHLH